MLKNIMRCLTPDHIVRNIYETDLWGLRDGGVKALILDIDNTLVRPGVKRPDEDAEQWLTAVQDMGFGVCLLSNASRRRVAAFASSYGVFAVSNARKPSSAGFLKALRLLGREPSQACMIGDQLFTDVLGAKRLGLKAVYSRPITKREGFHITLKRIPEHFLLRRFAAG